MLPFAIRLHKLDISRMHIGQADAPTLVLQDVTASSHTQDSTLVITSFSLNGNINDNHFQLTASGRLQLISPWQHELESAFDLSLPGQPAISGRAASRGDAERLNLTAGTSAPFSTELRLMASNLLRTPDWQATLTTRQADLSPWLDTDTPAILTADIDAGRHRRRYPR
ncbi:MAG: hypothetical protein U5P41_05280 [Gammaproteobacteria bacterium]|nr:hypothetical protein [Gammaproteobacteria bacterium]